MCAAPLPSAASSPASPAPSNAGRSPASRPHAGDSPRATRHPADARPKDPGEVGLHRRVRIANRAFGVFVTVCSAAILYEPVTAVVGTSLDLDGGWVRNAASTGALALAGGAFLSLYIAFCNAVEDPR